MGIFRSPKQGDKVEIKSPQHKDGKVHHWHYQVGIIYPDNLLFKSNKTNGGDHDVEFLNLYDLKDSIVRYL